MRFIIEETGKKRRLVVVRLKDGSMKIQRVIFKVIGKSSDSEAQRMQF